VRVFLAVKKEKQRKFMRNNILEIVVDRHNEKGP
jgi:hypothetical protein